jgi:hypothetical protein
MNPDSEQLGDFDEGTWTPVPRLLVPKSLPCDQPLEAHLSYAIAQHGAET